MILRPELHDKLGDCGHREKDDTKRSANIYPPAEIVVTVALNLEWTLLPEYRNNYFCTFVDDDCNPLIANDPKFALPIQFIVAAGREGRSWGRFTSGPMRWLFGRLVRFRRVLLWPDDAAWTPMSFVAPDLLEQLPSLRQLLGEAGPLPHDARAIVLEMENPLACSVLWEVAEIVESDVSNFYVSDAELTEVFMLHHHSKIVISVPGNTGRQALIAELNDLEDVLENCSNYILDDEDDGAGG